MKGFDAGSLGELRRSMLRVVVTRLLWSLPLLFVVSVVTFLLVSLTPGDPARTILGVNGTPQEYLQLRHALGLNLPIYSQYGHWLGRALDGNLGISLFNGEPVTTLLDSRLVVSLTLISFSTLVSVVIGVGLGVASAVRSGVAARVVDVIAKLGLSVPNFVVGLLLVLVFAVKLHLFPATGFVYFSAAPWQWFRALVLPVVTLSLAGATILAQQTRDAMEEALSQPFIHVLHANGFTRRSIVYRHALRTAAISIASLVGVVFVGLLSGTVLVETVFALPGLGAYAVQVTEQHDIPVIQGIALYFTFVVIAVNLAIDLLIAWLNPRVRIA
jgi:peptide/nickel transport system permease protein